MAICRQFLQGTCRYGNRCRYEHVYPNQHAYGGNYTYGVGGYGNYRGGGGGNYANSYGYSDNYASATGGNHSGGQPERGGMSILRAKANGGQFQQGPGIFGQATANTPATTQFAQNQGIINNTVTHQVAGNPQESKELLQMVINEFFIWEHSDLWPLSCFSLFEGHSCFPGLVDYSPEEIRWFMYQGRLAGNFEECQQYVKELLNKSKLIREQFMTPNALVLDILSRLLRGEKMDVSPPSPLFPQIKLNGHPLNAVGNVFSSNPGGNMTSATIATPSAPATSSVSSFSFTVPINGQENRDQSMGQFGVSQMNIIPDKCFNSNSSPNTGPSIFGEASQSLSGPQITPSMNNDYVIYTPMSELSEEAINAFNCHVYVMGSVPTKPPPKELCMFKRRPNFDRMDILNRAMETICSYLRWPKPQYQMKRIRFGQDFVYEATCKFFIYEMKGLGHTRKEAKEAATLFVIYKIVVFLKRTMFPTL